jgi:hypothetical protein
MNLDCFVRVKALRMILELEEKVHGCLCILETCVAVFLDSIAKVLLNKLFEFSDLSMLVTFEFEIGGVNIRNLVHSHGFNVIKHAVSNENDSLFILLFKFSQHLLDMVFDLGQGW